MNRKFELVVIGGSAGSFPVVRSILASIPKNIRVPLVFCLHRLKDVRSGLVESLASSSNIPVVEPEDKGALRPGYAYLAPANYHLLIEPSRAFSLSIDPEVHFSRPSIDLTFESAGLAYGQNMLGIILSGANVDGSRGLYQAHLNGACSVVQDPEEATVKTMPESTLKLFEPEAILRSEDITNFLFKMC